jgi:hypothetical protein
MDEIHHGHLTIMFYFFIVLIPIMNILSIITIYPAVGDRRMPDVSPNKFRDVPLPDHPPVLRKIHIESFSITPGQAVDQFQILFTLG